MPLYINTNVASTKAQNALSRNQFSLQANAEAEQRLPHFRRLKRKLDIALQKRFVHQTRASSLEVQTEFAAQVHAVEGT